MEGDDYIMKSRFLIPVSCSFAGVYVIVNAKNKKCYVGSSKNISNRINQHISQLKNNKSPVDEMQKDFNNGDNFIFHVVLKYHDSDVGNHRNKKNLLALEGKAIKAYDAVKSGYNKDDKLGITMYDEDIFYSKIYTDELIKYVDGTEDEPYINLWSGYKEKHKEKN